MQIVNNQTINVVMDDNISVFFCQKWGCKRINHTKSPNTVQTPALARVNVHTPETSPDIQAKIDQLTSTVSNLSSCVSKLANNTQAVTQVTSSSPNEPPRAPTTSNTNVIGMPAISNLENCKVNQGLQQRNILWTRVNSGGIDLPLPIDSCFSVSLVSGAHTDHLLKTNSQLKYTPLAHSSRSCKSYRTTQSYCDNGSADYICKWTYNHIPDALGARFSLANFVWGKPSSNYQCTR